MELLPGVYESLISNAIQQKLDSLSSDRFLIKKDDIDSAESYKMLSDYLGSVVGEILKGYFKEYDSALSISSQVEVINKILKFIETEWHDKDIDTHGYELSDESQLKFLRGIYDKIGYTPEQLTEKADNHPISGYRVSNLFTGGNDISIDDELKRDIQTANQIDLVVSFIKFEGLRLVYQSLKDFLAQPKARLRILTTTYMGATDPKALRKLYELRKAGDVEIRASFNNKQERLHAKSYIFYRDSGFDTAYIGSSNLSKSALTKGLEWNMRITSVENPHILKKTKATFENYWNSDDFEPIDSEEMLAKFEDAIWDQRNGKRSGDDTPEYVIRFERKTHQIKVLEKLQFERETLSSYKNLIIAATGTGKTAISAFDFKDFNAKKIKSQGRAAKLLFIAHREKILKQARSTYRSVLVDANFGEIWTGNLRPGKRGNLDHLFITVQTLNNNWEEFSKFGPDYYDYVVIDEAHHISAESYRAIFSRLSPEILIGLTATPERMDGKEIKNDFNDRFAAEIRLQEALNQRLLAPFDYFCISDDSVDLSMVPCKGDRYDNTHLTALYRQANKQRFAIIQKALDNYVTDSRECKAVCFCAGIEHAKMMEEMFNTHGYRAASVTSHNSADIDRLSNDLAHGKINYLCVADILNEGIDIPEIDTVLFLRPTESLTIFLQQLGRGLRLADGKTCLTVLDFVAQASQSYNYENRFRALVGRSTKSISNEIENGFKFLPAGCSITMEKQAQEFILQNIKDAIFNRRRIIHEARNFTQNTGQDLNVENFLNNFGLDIRDIYNRLKSWARLKHEIGKGDPGFEANCSMTKLLEGGLTRLHHSNSYEYLSFLKRLISHSLDLHELTKREEKFLTMFYYTIFLDPIEKLNKTHQTHFKTIAEAVAYITDIKWFAEDLNSLIDLLMKALSHTTTWISVRDGIEIELYGCYSADEIHILLEDKPGRWLVAGTQYNHEHKFAMVFVTLNKSDKDYSPSTLYEDYAISQRQFHWQSMNKTRQTSPEGQRIINQRDNGWKFLLFVRDSKYDEYNNTNSYYCLGLMDINRSHGECPINVVWDMNSPIPGFILEKAKAI